MKLLWSMLMVVVCLAVVHVYAEESADATQAQAVESSLLKSVAYDAATSTLTVVMVEDNAAYEYKNVPESVYKELMAAESKGTYFVKNIKGKYEFTKQ